MASAEILDFATLLAPISEAQPSGVELKSDKGGMAEYTAIKSAREAARAAERESTKAEKSQELLADAAKHWKLVADRAPQVIATMSKDLWIAAWLLEALTRQHGFAGARDGFRLIREICERYWDGIHPAPDEEGYLTTVIQLAALNGTEGDGALIAPLAAIQIVEAASGTKFSGADYFYAIEADESMTTREKRDRLRTELEQAMRAIPPEGFAGRLEDATACLNEFDLLTRQLDAKCGQGPDGMPAAPQSSRIREQLALAVERLKRLTGEPDAAGEAAAGAADTTTGPATAAGGTAAGPIQTRDDALRQLLSVAAFFRRTEPHSPVSYALEQVVRWGRMTLPELIRELISDDGTRNELARRTGVPVNPTEP